MSTHLKFSFELFHARKRMGLTQEQAAEALDISVRWYQEIESGRKLPGASLILKIIAHFEINGKNLKEDAA